MASILDPTPPIRFQIARLRQAVASDARFTDADLLGLLNDGYRSACERSECLETIVTIVFDPDATEAPLPSDHVRTIRVYQAGAKLEPIPYQHSAELIAGTYYQYQGVIGLSVLGDPSGTATIAMLYARTPVALGYDDTPEWGREWDYILRHYAAWQCILASGGAQTIRKAVAERVAYEDGIRRLRHQAQRRWGSGLSRVRHASQIRVAPIAG